MTYNNLSHNNWQTIKNTAAVIIVLKLCSPDYVVARAPIKDSYLTQSQIENSIRNHTSMLENTLENLNLKFEKRNDNTLTHFLDYNNALNLENAKPSHPVVKYDRNAPKRSFDSHNKNKDNHKLTSRDAYESNKTSNYDKLGNSARMSYEMSKDLQGSNVPATHLNQKNTCRIWNNRCYISWNSNYYTAKKPIQHSQMHRFIKPDHNRKNQN